MAGELELLLEPTDQQLKRVRIVGELDNHIGHMQGPWVASYLRLVLSCFMDYDEAVATVREVWHGRGDCSVQAQPGDVRGLRGGGAGSPGEVSQVW